MTREEFAKAWIVLPDEELREKLLSDLNEVIRGELIRFADNECLSSTKYDTYEEWIDEYLKQQK